MRAIIVAGDEDRFERNLARWKIYLSMEVKIDQISLFHQNRFDVDKFKKSLLEKPGVPIILIYNGHGSKNGWSLKFCSCCEKWQYLKYETLAKLLQEVRSPVYLINDCCYSFSVVHWLKKYSRKYPISLLAAGPKNKISYSMSCDVITSWYHGEIYHPRDYSTPLVYLKTLQILKLKWVGKIRENWFQVFISQFITWLNRLIPKKYNIRYVINIEETLGNLRLDQEKEVGQYWPERPRWGETFDHLLFPRQLKLRF